MRVELSIDVPAPVVERACRLTGLTEQQLGPAIEATILDPKTSEFVITALLHDLRGVPNYQNPQDTRPHPQWMRPNQWRIVAAH